MDTQLALTRGSHHLIEMSLLPLVTFFIIREASAEKLLLSPAELPSELETGLGLGVRLELIFSAL